MLRRCFKAMFHKLGILICITVTYCFACSKEYADLGKIDSKAGQSCCLLATLRGWRGRDYMLTIEYWDFNYPYFCYPL